MIRFLFTCLSLIFDHGNLRRIFGFSKNMKKSIMSCFSNVNRMGMSKFKLTAFHTLSLLGMVRKVSGSFYVELF